MTTLQKSLVTAAIAAAVGAGIFEARQASTLRSQVETLRRQQAPLADQLAQLRAENESLSNQLNQARDSQALSKNQLSELLKLRGQAGMAGSDSRELARLKSTMARQSGAMPDYMTNAIGSGAGHRRKIQAQGSASPARPHEEDPPSDGRSGPSHRRHPGKHVHSQSRIAMDLMSNNRAAEVLQATGGTGYSRKPRSKRSSRPNNWRPTRNTNRRRSRPPPTIPPTTTPAG